MLPAYLKKLKDALSILFQKQLTFNTPLRYFIAVTCGFCVDFLIYAIIVSGGISVYLANAAGFSVGVIINLILIRKYVFPDSRFRFRADLPFTFAVNGTMLGVGMFLLWLLVEFALINPYLAKILANGVTFVLNYIIRAAFFRKK